MIVKMNKYSIVVLNEDSEQFLHKLQELGMMDITRSEQPIDDHSQEMFTLSQRIDNTVTAIRSVTEKIGEENIIPADNNSLEEVINRVEDLLSKRENIQRSLKQDTADLAEAVPWGEFNPDDLKKVRDLGYDAHFYTLPQKKFSEDLSERYIMKELNRVNNLVYFVILTPEGDVQIPSNETKFPALSAPTLQARIKRYNLDIDTIEKEIASHCKLVPELTEYQNRTNDKADIYLASSSATKEGENKIWVLTGFTPSKESAEIDHLLDNSSVVYIKEDAVVEDNPPVKLKNGWFSRLFEPIGELYLLPQYNELDLTRYFAPFYMLFFGLCLGDIGYGLILITIGLIAQKKLPKFKSYAKLIVFLGIGTVIMPILSGTFFGAKLYDLFDMPESISDLFLTDINMFWFALIFGIVHLIVARILSMVNIMRMKGFPNGLHEIGWVFLLIAGPLAYAGMETGSPLVPPTVLYALLIAGVALILFFTKTEGNFFIRTLSSITFITDIPTLFGDILSYIRLFGLGLSGGCLGLVINTLSLQLSEIPYIGWALTIFLLTFGHLFIMAMCCIGAFVHPVRLTFVEFYKNEGFEGGGREYRPLKKTADCKS